MVFWRSEDVLWPLTGRDDNVTTVATTSLSTLSSLKCPYDALLERLFAR